MPRAPRQTCTTCSRRRQMCDKRIPCGRCVKNGEADSCTRTWPEKYDPKIHRTYPKMGHRRSNQRSEATASPVNQAPSLHDTEHSIALSPTQSHTTDEEHARLRSRSIDHTVSDQAHSTTTAAGASSDDRSLEFVTWGRTKLSELGIGTPGIPGGPNIASDDVNHDVPDEDLPDLLDAAVETSQDVEIRRLQTLMPSKVQVLALVDYHMQSLLWFHDSLHEPTFRSELTKAYHSSPTLQISGTDFRWTGLLFSILAASITCSREPNAESWGFTPAQKARLSKQWYNASVSSLLLGEYTNEQHIYSIQALIILSLTAHIIGRTREQSVNWGIAKSIAQGLGLQRLGVDAGQDLIVNDTRLRTRVIQREVGRRLWSQLCAHDWHAITWSGMYGMNKLHFTTIRPMVCDDNLERLVDFHEPSIVHFSNIVYATSSLIAEFHDIVCSSTSKEPTYRDVLLYDSKIRALGDHETLPKFLASKEPIDPEWPQWVTWARREIDIAQSHKIIVMHKSFLSRSFKQSQFAYSRWACINASKAIVTEVEAALADEGPLWWIDQAFLVAAGITFALDIFNQSTKEDTSTTEEKLSWMEKTIGLLSGFQESLLASNGTRLLKSLLEEYLRSSTTNGSPLPGSERAPSAALQHTDPVNPLGVFLRDSQAEEEQFSHSYGGQIIGNEWNPVPPTTASTNGGNKAKLATSGGSFFDGIPVGPGSQSLDFEALMRDFATYTGFENDILF